jgi:hypothetical protein
MEVVDENVVGGLELLVAEIPLGRPRELAVAERAALSHPGRPEVQAAREQRRMEMLLQIAHPRGRASGVCELAGEPGPPLDLGEQIGNVDVRHQSIQLCSQPDGSGVLIQRVRW